MNRWFFFSIALTGLALAGSLYVYYGLYDRMPEQVPTHWGINGQPDQFTPREKMLPMLLILPGAMAGLVILTKILPWLSPRGFDVERFQGTYNYVMAVTVALLGYIHLAISYGYVKPGLPTVTWMVGGISLFFAAFGNVIGKVQRNFWIGVRTPWTLADERVWNQTHRLTGWLWTPFGLIGCVAILLGLPLVIYLVGLAVTAFLPVVYSLVLYKRLQRQGKLTTASSEIPGEAS